MTPGNSTSLKPSMAPSHQRCAHADEASQAPALALYIRASSRVRPKPSSWTCRYGRKNGSVRPIDTAAASAISPSTAADRQSPRVTAKSSVASPTISPAKMP